MLVATITTGWIAELYYAFRCSVVIVFRTAGDRTYIDVMRWINAAILNGWFFLGFVGVVFCLCWAFVVQ